jgi:hypothetical protein
MPTQPEPVLTTDIIEALARQRLPKEYALLGVRMTMNDHGGSLPNALEIEIAFENRSTDPFASDIKSIRAFQDWSNPLIDQIRREWPKEAVRISFAQREPS